jgi:exopolysaccharide biosynthesis WecB/TagA/CpsF family protein
MTQAKLTAAQAPPPESQTLPTPADFPPEPDSLVLSTGLRAELNKDLPPAPKSEHSQLISDEDPAKVPASSGRSENVESSAQLLNPPTSVDAIAWPPKLDILGVEVSVTNYQDLTRLLITAAHRREPVIATFLAVHAIVTGATDPAYRYRVNGFEVVAPDGMPVRWAMNYLHKANLPDRVAGPYTMLHLCEAAAEEGVGVYLYGSTPDTLQRLEANLQERYPGIRIVGTESPPFRPLTADENDAVVDRINASGAGLVFIGLGMPRQDLFAHQNRNRIQAVQLCIGAAFDFHAGKKKLAPAWMQRAGLEWTYRLIQEPRRLWKRYLVTNTIFVYLMAKRVILKR